MQSQLFDQPTATLVAAIITGLATGVVAGVVGALATLARFRRERAFDRRLAWSERMARTLAETKLDVEVASTFEEDREESSEAKEQTWGKVQRMYLQLTRRVAEAKLYATQDVASTMRSTLNEFDRVSNLTNGFDPRQCGKRMREMQGLVEELDGAITAHANAVRKHLKYRRLLSVDDDSNEPVGGYGGEPFSDSIPMGARLAQVRVRAGNWIDALQLVCEAPNGKRITLPQHGGDGGDGWASLDLAEGQYLKCVSGRYGDYIDHLTLWIGGPNTEIASAPDLDVGGEGGHTDFSYIAPPKSQIIGLSGRAGQYIDAIGAVYGPRTRPFVLRWLRARRDALKKLSWVRQ